MSAKSDFDDSITVIEGVALRFLLVDIGDACGINVDPDGRIYKISIQKRAAGVAFKINEGVWTPTLATAEMEN